MLGASFGGTMRGAHQAVDCSAASLITPPNCGCGAGSWLPGIVVVASGAPGVPVVWTGFAASACEARDALARKVSGRKRQRGLMARF